MFLFHFLNSKSSYFHNFCNFFLREPHILLVFINIREYIYKNKSKNSLDINNFDNNMLKWILDETLKK